MIFNIVSDDVFIKDLKNSEKIVEQIAEILKQRGYSVRIPETRIRPDLQNRNEYSDHGDLFVESRIEVKYRKELIFTGIKDFPYRTIIVCEKYTWDRMKIKPLWWFIVNSDKTRAIVVDGSTHDKWLMRESYDKRAKQKCTYMECPIDICKVLNLK